MNLLLTVVIPTFGRPEYLERAINSALLSSIDNSVEVIVVPNGPDQSWKKIEAKYNNNPKVKFQYCAIAHGNAARNVGLSLAKGTYIRFLDDDDYLYPENARQQLVLMRATGGDVCSGKIDIVDENGNNYGLCSFPESNDFVEANLRISGITLPCSNVYLRKKLKVDWDENISRAQDHIFIIDLISNTELVWVKCNSIVGCWFQHSKDRVSLNKSALKKNQIIPRWCFDRLIKLHSILRESNRLTDARSKEISAALWQFIDLNYEKNPSECNYLIDEIKSLGIGNYNYLGERFLNHKMILYFVRSHPELFIRVKKIVKSVCSLFFQKYDNNDYIRKI